MTTHDSRAAHDYRTVLDWRGSTAAGYRGYSRDHVVTAAPALERLRLSADPAFRGDPSQLNPEQLLLAAASSCQLLSFLAVAARAGLDVRAYADAADARLVGDRIEGIVLRPVITVAPGTPREQVRQAIAEAHDGCYVANSLVAPVVVDAVVVDAVVVDAVVVDAVVVGDAAGGHEPAASATEVDLEVHLDAAPDALARLASILGAAGVSLEGGGAFAAAAGAAAGHERSGATAHFLVADGARGAAALRAAGYDPVVRRVVATRLDQARPGTLARALHGVASSGVDLLAQYSDHDGRLILVVDDADREAAAVALAGA